MIDGDALKDRLQALSYDDWNQGVSTTWANAYAECADMVEDMPTIEPERKKGKWIWDGESRREYPYKCSECGEIDYYAFLYDSDTREYKQQDNFCPNCGADMRGEQP